MPSVYFAAVNAEFNWWLLIVGLVVGAGLVWFVLADPRRREVDIDAEERPREAAWLSAASPTRAMMSRPRPRNGSWRCIGPISRRRHRTSRRRTRFEPVRDPRR